jgi:hypothetical protein
VAVRQGFDPQADIDRSVAQLVRVAQRVASFGIWFGIVAVPILLTLAVCLGLVLAIAALARRFAVARTSRAD